MLFKRIRIPLIIDIVYIDDPNDLYELNENRYIDRNARHRFSLANLIAHSYFYNLITARSAYFPTFMEREDPERARLQKWLEEKLSGTEPPKELVQDMAEFVTGDAGGTEISMAIQNLCGQAVNSSFVATLDTVNDARIVSDYIRAGLLRKLLLLSTSRMLKARERLWQIVNEDRVLMHAVVLGPHGIRRALDNMKQQRNDPKLRGRTDGSSIVGQCLVAPKRLLRFSNNIVPFSKGRSPLRPGSLVVFLLQRVHFGTTRNDIAFLERTWSQCPAHEFIPRLLRDVWRRAESIEQHH